MHVVAHLDAALDHAARGGGWVGGGSNVHRVAHLDAALDHAVAWGGVWGGVGVWCEVVRVRRLCQAFCAARDAIMGTGMRQLLAR